MGRTIFVRRSILSASQRLQALSDSSAEINTVDLAEHKIEDCREAGDGTGVKFWRSVWTYLMRTRQTTVCFHVIEDGDGPVKAADADGGVASNKTGTGKI